MAKSNGRRSSELKELSLLGSQTNHIEANYNPKLLERFPNKHPKNDQWITFVCTEFTSLCPITGQPDFAKIFINYIASDWMVESKSLKLYLFSFRNHGDFHEDCVQKMCNDISGLIKPKYIEVIGEFTPRGGIAIFPYSSEHNGTKEYKYLSEQRKIHYSPGKYSLDLGRPY
jgi:7-cyano-7-deazaguanine reductase